MKKRQIKIEKGLLELLGEGNQFVACGSHSSGARYQWQGGLPTEIPTVTMAALNQTWSELTSRFAKSPSTHTMTAPAMLGGPGSSTQELLTSAPSSSASGTNSQTLLREISNDDWPELISALRFLAPYAGDEQLWAEIGISLLSLQNSRKPVRQLWLDFSAKAPNWQPGAAERWWETHK